MEKGEKAFVALLAVLLVLAFIIGYATFVYASFLLVMGGFIVLFSLGYLLVIGVWGWVKGLFN